MMRGECQGDLIFMQLIDSLKSLIYTVLKKGYASYKMFYDQINIKRISTFLIAQKKCDILLS